MGREGRAALVCLAASVACWAFSIRSPGPGGVWAWAMLALATASAVLAARASRSAAGSGPSDARVRADTARRAADHGQDGRLTDMAQRLAAVGIAMDGSEGPEAAFRHGMTHAALATGMDLLDAGHPEEALSAFESALGDMGEGPADTRTRALAHALCAQAHEKRAALDHARREYQRALELDPEQRQAREALSRLER